MQSRRYLIFASTLVLAACEAEPPARDEAARPAAETTPAQPRPEVEGYHPDSLAWFREGRTVIFETRNWRPVGQPLPAPADAFQRVGEFEGMALYAAAEDSPPYDTLFFPLGNDLWQPLEPADSVLSENNP